MEAGEDPDKIEEEMGDALESDEMLWKTAGGKLSMDELKKRIKPPRVDPTLYDLE
jgi:hypothetical protein